MRAPLTSPDCINPNCHLSAWKKPIDCALYARVVDRIGQSNPICAVSERSEPIDCAPQARAAAMFSRRNPKYGILKWKKSIVARAICARLIASSSDGAACNAAG